MTPERCIRSLCIIQTDGMSCLSLDRENQSFPGMTRLVLSAEMKHVRNTKESGRKQAIYPIDFITMMLLLNHNQKHACWLACSSAVCRVRKGILGPCYAVSWQKEKTDLETVEALE
jgi:hypothetical protein